MQLNSSSEMQCNSNLNSTAFFPVVKFSNWFNPVIIIFPFLSQSRIPCPWLACWLFEMDGIMNGVRATISAILSFTFKPSLYTPNNQIPNTLEYTCFHNLTAKKSNCFLPHLIRLTFFHSVICTCHFLRRRSLWMVIIQVKVKAIRFLL